MISTRRLMELAGIPENLIEKRLSEMSDDYESDLDHEIWHEFRKKTTAVA